MKIQIIVWFLIGVIMVGIGFYVYKNQLSQGTIKQTTSLIENTNIPEEDQYEVEVIPIKDTDTVSIATPDLNRSIVFSDDVSDEERKKTVEKITQLTEELKKDSSLVSSWIELGLYRKLIGDYEGARDVWEYVVEINSLNPVPYLNLGDLYHYYLKDFPKAEENFRKVIENDKSNLPAYIGLHELYKYSYKQNTELVSSILFEGIGNNPSNVNLLITLASYYKEIGDIENAKKHYTQARDEAQKQGNTQLVELLTEEISQL